MKSKFTITTQAEKTFITDATSGISAELYKEGESWLSRNHSNTQNLSDKRIAGICKRMVNWFYFNHVKKLNVTQPIH